MKLQITFTYEEDIVEDGLVSPAKMPLIKTVELSTQREKLIKKIRSMTVTELSKSLKVNLLL